MGLHASSLLSWTVLLLVVSVADAPTPAQGAVVLTKHGRCVEAGHTGANRRSGHCPGRRALQPAPFAITRSPSHAVPSGPETTVAPASSESDRGDPGRLTTQELRQTTADVPVENSTADVVVRGSRLQSPPQFEASQKALIQQKAEARRRALVGQAMDQIRTDTSP
jgi:hypothetical protein